VSAEMSFPEEKPAQEPVVIVTVAEDRAGARTDALGFGSSLPSRRSLVVSSHQIAWHVRASLVLIATILIGVFSVAWWLNPYNPDGTPRRMATHRQLGLPPCNFVILTGKPCPSCGMTTSFALFIRGDLRASLQANWVGTLLAAGAVIALPWSLLSAWRGRLLGIPSGYGDYLLTSALALLLILMLGRWFGLLLTSTDTTALPTDDHHVAMRDLTDIGMLSHQTDSATHHPPLGWGTRGENGFHRGVMDEPHLSLAPPQRMGCSAGGHRLRL